MHQLLWICRYIQYVCFNSFYIHRWPIKLILINHIVVAYQKKILLGSYECISAMHEPMHWSSYHIWLAEAPHARFHSHLWKRYQNTWTPLLGGSGSLPTRREQSTVFMQRTVASDLEMLTIMPTASHSTAKPHPSACRRSQSEEGNITTSSAEEQQRLGLPNQKLSSSRLQLEILSSKTTNRVGDTDQPCWSATLDFVLMRWTQLSLHWGSDGSWQRATPYFCSALHRWPKGKRSVAVSEFTKHM